MSSHVWNRERNQLKSVWCSCLSQFRALWTTASSIWLSRVVCLHVFLAPSTTCEADDTEQMQNIPKWIATKCTPWCLYVVPVKKRVDLNSGAWLQLQECNFKKEERQSKSNEFPVCAPGLKHDSHEHNVVCLSIGLSRFECVLMTVSQYPHQGPLITMWTNLSQTW